MRNILTATAFSLALIFSQPVMAKDIYIAVSPWQARESADREMKSVLTFLANTVDHDDEVHLIDGYRPPPELIWLKSHQARCHPAAGFSIASMHNIKLPATPFRLYRL